MEQEKTPQLDYEKLEAEFRELVDAWKSTWTPIGHLGQTAGPQGRMYERMKPHFPEKRLAARKPEEEAHKRVIDYAATAIIIAARVSEFDRVMQIIDMDVGFRAPNIDAEREFMEDILKEVATRLTKTADSGPKPEIREIVAACRTNLGIAVTFGLIDPSTGSG